MRESRLAVQAERYNASSDANSWLGRIQSGGIRGGIFFDQLRSRRSPIKFVRVGFMAPRLNLGKFFLALEELIGRIKR